MRGKGGRGDLLGDEEGVRVAGGQSALKEFEHGRDGGDRRPRVGQQLRRPQPWHAPPSGGVAVERQDLPSTLLVSGGGGGVVVDVCHW